VSCGVEPGAGASLPAEDVPTTTSEPSGADSADPPVSDEPSTPDDQIDAPDDDTGAGDTPDGADDPEPDPTPEPTACDDATEIFALCDSPLSESCESPEQAECLLATPSVADGYCDIEAGGELCDGGEPSRSLYEWCAVEACLGADYFVCVETYSTGCVPQVCEDIDTVVGQCEGFGYDCVERDPVEAACLLEVFEALTTPCGLFVDSPLCMGFVVSEWGFGSCHVQRCTGVTTFEECYANLEILCSVAGL